MSDLFPQLESSGSPHAQKAIKPRSNPLLLSPNGADGSMLTDEGHRSPFSHEFLRFATGTVAPEYPPVSLFSDHTFALFVDQAASAALDTGPYPPGAQYVGDHHGEDGALSTYWEDDDHRNKFGLRPPHLDHLPTAPLAHTPTFELSSDGVVLDDAGGPPAVTMTALPKPTGAISLFATPPEDLARDDMQIVDTGYLDEIRSKFPCDLTMYITRDGKFPVAAGGCADIYRGTFHVSKTAIKVAIKVIKVYSAEDNHPKKTKRLRREMMVWMKVNHTNVLPLFGTTSGFGPFPAMVCPWLDNGTLTSYLERLNRDMGIRQVPALIYDVACGLQYLHLQSIVHGDLSGSNVLVDASGRAWIADFGLSTVLDEIGRSTFATSSTGKPRGTLRWAAPELLDLLDHDEANTPRTGPTVQSDIYSFGGIMLQILSGKVPYHYYSRDMQIVAAIFRGETPIRPNDSSVTDCQWEFIQRCWSPFKDVVRRPSSEEIVAFSRGDLARSSPQAV